MFIFSDSVTPLGLNDVFMKISCIKTNCSLVVKNLTFGYKRRESFAEKIDLYLSKHYLDSEGSYVDIENMHNNKSFLLYGAIVCGEDLYVTQSTDVKFFHVTSGFIREYDSYIHEHAIEIPYGWCLSAVAACGTTEIVFSGLLSIIEKEIS